MSVTLSEIAKKLGVSTSTVSKVLNNRSGVSDEVRVKILKTAEQLRYFPYIKARESGIFRQSSKYVVEIFGYANEHILFEITNGLKNVINASKYYEIAYKMTDIENKDSKLALFFDHILRDKDICGLISVFVPIDEKIINEFQKNNVYISLVNTRTDIASYVVIDEKKAAHDAVTYLFRTGCRKIGLITPGNRVVPVWNDRIEGFKSGLKECGIDYNPDLIEYETTFQVSNVKLATAELLRKNPGVDAIIYASDIQAYSGMQYLKQQNIRIPDHISVMGFDDLEFSSFIEPSLTSVRQPFLDAGKIAASNLMDMIDAQKSIIKKQVLETKIIERASTRKIVSKADAAHLDTSSSGSSKTTRLGGIESSGMVPLGEFPPPQDKADSRYFRRRYTD
jgi:LacI family transcriptional regulator